MATDAARNGQGGALKANQLDTLLNVASAEE